VLTDLAGGILAAGYLLSRLLQPDLLLVLAWCFAVEPAQRRACTAVCAFGRAHYASNCWVASTWPSAKAALAIAMVLRQRGWRGWQRRAWTR